MSNFHKKFYDVARLNIWGDTQGDDNKTRPRMVFSFRDGNPRFTVYAGGTGIENMITFPSDPATMVGVMWMIKDIIKGPPGEKFIVDSLGAVYKDNKPTNEKRTVGSLYVGKSKEGLIYFSVIADGKPKHVFTIKPSPYHVFRDGNKNTLPDAKISEYLASGLVDTMLNIIGNVMIQYTNEEYNDGARKQGVIKTNTPGGTGGQGGSNNTPKPDIVQDLDDLVL